MLKVRGRVSNISSRNQREERKRKARGVNLSAISRASVASLGKTWEGKGGRGRGKGKAANPDLPFGVGGGAARGDQRRKEEPSDYHGGARGDIK